MKGKYQVTFIDLKANLHDTVNADCLKEATEEANKKAEKMSNSEHTYKPWIILPLGVER